MSGVGIRQLSGDDPERLGAYRLLGRLGSGGMGRVYLARSVEDGSLVAVKTLLAEGLVSETDRRRFDREVRLARRIDGPDFARVLDADPDAERPWMAIEYIPAPALSELVQSEGALPVPAVRWIAAGTAKALVTLHSEGIVHRDVKPQNILLPLAGPRLIDFGISHAHDITRTSLTLGTIAFTSPEQARAEPSTPASDVYSLGATLFHIAVGRPPYPDTGDTIRLLTLVQRGDVDLTGLPDDLAPLIHPCLATDPDDRPEPAAVLRRLRQGPGRVPTGRRSHSSLPPGWRTRIKEYEIHGRALREGRGSEDPTVNVPPPDPTRVGTQEANRRREEQREREREERERREREERERREREERERRARAERERRERERRQREPARTPSTPSTPSTNTPANSSSSASFWVVAALIALVVFIWQPWKDDGGSAGASSETSSTTSGGTDSGGTTGSSTGGSGSTGTSSTGGSSSEGSSSSTSSSSTGGTSSTGSGGDAPASKPSTPTPDTTERAFKRVSAGQCLPVYDTGRGGRSGVKWSASIPPPAVSCSSDRAKVQVTSTTRSVCPSGTGKSSWSYGSTRLCLTRIYHARYCLLATQSGDRITLGSMTSVDCRQSKVPVPYNQIMHITGVYRATAGVNANNCRRSQGDQTRYWAWKVNDGKTLLCTMIFRG